MATHQVTQPAGSSQLNQIARKAVVGAAILVLGFGLAAIVDTGQDDPAVASGSSPAALQNGAVASLGYRDVPSVSQQRFEGRDAILEPAEHGEFTSMMYRDPSAIRQRFVGKDANLDSDAALGSDATRVGAVAAIPSSKSSTETLDLAGQGPDGDSVGTAELKRSNNGMNFKVRMPTPEPGSYIYPDGAANDGGPEVFTLWAFVFADPSACGEDGCAGIPDVVASGGGVFAVAGHVSGGGNLVLSGRISKNTEPFDPDGDGPVAFSKLSNPRTAEVHIAVAPHGTKDESQLQTQLTTPIGGPAEWWIALFK